MNIYSLTEVKKCLDLIRLARPGMGPVREGAWVPVVEVWLTREDSHKGIARGLGRGRGFGMGSGPGLYGNYTEPEPLSKEAQKQLLEAALRRLEAEKAEIERRLTTIE